MIKVALIAAAAAAASMAQGGGAEPARTPGVAAVPCATAQSLGTGCALRPLDANGDGLISPAELAAFASPAPAPEPAWTPLPPSPRDLDFDGAAAEPPPAMPVATDRHSPPTLLSALLALGALVMLLRRRPT